MMKRSRNVRYQTISAILMALMGTAVHAGSQFYLSPYDIKKEEPKQTAVVIPPVVLEETKPAETMPEPETEAEEVFTPSLSVLNLAYVYPEGSEETDAQESVAGQIIRDLSVKDSQWLASIYELSSQKPEEAAVKSGLPAEAVRGLYNPLDENQKEDDPGTWAISEWSHIDMAFYDENGKRIMADSNIKEIMALANTYFYYTAPEDGDAFYDYALKLWKQSHSVQYSVGEVYYCDGCLEKGAAAGDLKESEVPGVSETAEGTESETQGLSAAASEETASVEIGPGIPTVASLEENMAAESSSALGDESEAESPAESDTSAEPKTELAAAGQQESAGQTDGSQESEPSEIGPGIALMKAASSAETIPEEEEPPVKCPGHVDLHITATIVSLSGSGNSLFSMADRLGREEEGSAFSGWNDANKNAAKNLAEQDWKEVYGLTVSSTYITNPLSDSEMAYYLSLLPPDTTEERRKLIRCALSSVGKIPYYWGGKPSAPDYDGNYFGSLTAADEKGRTMKGLDCSGWISWVYWSAAGIRLPSESTDGLKDCGTAVAREDLKPGDIIVRLGEEGHVVMFLAWENDGKMKVLHESSGSVNNVTISTMQADWPYYRKLID